MGQKVQGSSFSSIARDAPELAALQGLVAASSGVCCVAAASSHAPELVALQQASKQDFLPFRVRVGPAPTPATPLQLQPLQLHSHSSNSRSTAARGLWSSGDGVKGGWGW